MSEHKLLAVTGNPVLHSKSPCMFSNVFEQTGINADYVRLAADSAKEAIELFRNLNLVGMNVTAPFKEDVMPLLDVVDSQATLIGGVNTIVNKDGKLYGYNTDHYGVAHSLLHAHVQLHGTPCVVIGAGGAGKAAAYGLIKQGAKVTIANRTIEKARDAAQSLGCNYAGLDQLQNILAQSDVVVFSLSQNINPVDSSWLESRHVIFDANYKSSEFSVIAREKGCKIIEGIDWLLNQAIPSYEYFLGNKPDEALMKAGLAQYNLKEKSNKIALVGFMGSGKTTIGKKLAKKLDITFVDTDEQIVAREGKSIPEIFAQHGETYFRQLEHDVMQQLFDDSHKMIISCGGGLAMHEGNRKLLKQHCLVIWLTATPESIIGRIKLANRPLLNVENPLERANQLLAQRKHLYAAASDVVINTEYFNTDIITQKVYEEISKTFGY